MTPGGAIITAIIAWLAASVAFAGLVGKHFGKSPHDSEADIAERAVSLGGFIPVNSIHNGGVNSK